MFDIKINDIEDEVASFVNNKVYDFILFKIIMLRVSFFLLTSCIHV